MDTNEMIQFMETWASENNARLVLEGECGIGRECVGILANGISADPHKSDVYPTFHDFLDEDYDEPALWVTKDAQPPSEVDRNYHKHDCLAVLGRDEESIRQLYVWIKALKDRGVVIRCIPFVPTQFTANDQIIRSMQKKNLVLKCAPGISAARDGLARWAGARGQMVLTKPKLVGES